MNKSAEAERAKYQSLLKKYNQLVAKTGVTAKKGRAQAHGGAKPT